jgi:hypothetical protein
VNAKSLSGGGCRQFRNVWGAPKVWRVMKKVLAVVLFCLPTFGQATYSGRGSFSWPASYASSGAAPLTYSARTDNCVTGSESGCVFDRTTGQAGSALSFLLRPSDTVPFQDISTGNANMNATATDPDFGTYLVMATDETTANALASSHPYASPWDMGSAGEWDAFSVDSKLLLVRNGEGGATILYLNPASIHAQTCSATPCVAESGIGSVAPLNSLHLAVNGDWDFSRVPTETNVLYELENPPTQVDRLVVCRFTSDPGCGSATPNTVLRSAYADFTNINTSVCGGSMLQNFGNTTAYSTSWTSTFVVANDGSVAYGMTGGQDWQASWTPAVNESFILPQTGNSGNYGFQATTVTGATGATAPNWTSCNTVGSCTDGGVTWTSIGSLGGQGPGFDVVIYRPSQGCTRVNTRIGKIYRGPGNIAPAGMATTQDDIACTRATGATCGSSSITLPDLYTLHDLSQAQNGQYVIITPTGAEGTNAPGSWNSGTLTGQTSNAIWAGSVSGGSINGGVWTSTASYSTHDVVVDGTLGYPGTYYTALTNISPAGAAPHSNANWSSTEAYPLNYTFDTTGTLISPCTDYLDCNGHTAQGYLTKYYGSKYKSSLYLLPAVNGLLNPDVAMLGSALCSDDHGTYRNSGTADLTPISLSTADVPAWYTRYSCAGYVEALASSSDGLNTLYRLGHEYNSGSNPQFQVQNGICVVSYLGDLMACGTDMMGYRGDTSAASTACINNLRGMFKPSASTAFAGDDTLGAGNGNTILPVTNNPNADIYRAIVGGTTASSVPNWSAFCPSVGTCLTQGGLDGSVTWFNAGPNSCRGDDMILDLLSAHALP